MKMKSKIFGKLLVVLFVILTIACGKDDGESVAKVIEVLPGISLQEFEIDQGEIGISINARAIARKGYKPTNADITIKATTGDYSQKIPFDAFTNIANLSLKNEDLTDEAKSELKNGVAITVKVLDENDNILTTKDISNGVFTSNPSEEVISADDLEDLYKKVTIREDIYHFVQIVTTGSDDIYGAPNSTLFVNTILLNTPILISQLADLDYNSENTQLFTSYRFKEVPGEEGVFTIAAHNGDDIHYLYIVPANSELRIQSKANLIRNGGNNTGTPPNYKFKINKVEIGLYEITPTFTGNPLVLLGDRLNAGAVTTNSEPVYFRILSFDIDWDVQPIESKFTQPILPASVISETYNKTLRNCSNSTLPQMVGKLESLETSAILSWEESMLVSTDTDYVVPLTIEMDAATKFFNTIGATKISTTGNYTFNKSKTINKEIVSGTIEQTQSIDFSEERTVEIFSRTAVAIADVYQTYENVKIPFVQRFKIKGTYQENNQTLTGEEIMTQFGFNGFTGVITTVENNYIEVTVKGTSEINKLIETKMMSQNVEAGCDN